MNPVVPVQVRIERNPCEKKRHERQVVSGGETREQLMVVDGVVPPVHRWCFHPTQQNGHTACAGTLDDGGEIRLYRSEWRSTQAVVRTELEYQDGRVRRQRAFEPLNAIAGRVAPDTLVRHEDRKD